MVMLITIPGRRNHTVAEVSNCKWRSLWNNDQACRMCGTVLEALGNRPGSRFNRLVYITLLHYARPPKSPKEFWCSEEETFSNGTHCSWAGRCLQGGATSCSFFCFCIPSKFGQCMQSVWYLYALYFWTIFMNFLRLILLKKMYLLTDYWKDLILTKEDNPSWWFVRSNLSSHFPCYDIAKNKDAEGLLKFNAFYFKNLYKHFCIEYAAEITLRGQKVPLKYFYCKCRSFIMFLGAYLHTRMIYNLCFVSFVQAWSRKSLLM